MAGPVNGVVGGIEGQVMNMHGGLVLLDDLFFFQVIELDEAIVITSGGQEPLVVRVKDHLLHESLVSVAAELVSSFSLFPIKDLDPGEGFEVVDIVDRAGATDCQQ